MKVIYKKKVSEKIYEEILKAKLEDKQIEKIILTVEEFDSLCSEAFHMKYTSFSNRVAIFCGIKIEADV